MKRTFFFASLFILVAACGGRVDSENSNGPAGDRASPGTSGNPGSDGDSPGSGIEQPATETCSVPLAAFCAKGQTTYPTPPDWIGACPASLAAAEDPSAWCVPGNDQLRLTVETCGSTTAVVYSGVDNEIWFIYDASSTLIAVTYNDPDQDACYGGPSDFVRPEGCTWGPDLCSEAVDAGAD